MTFVKWENELILSHPCQMGSNNPRSTVITMNQILIEISQNMYDNNPFFYFAARKYVKNEKIKWLRERMIGIALLYQCNCEYDYYL